MIPCKDQHQRKSPCWSRCGSPICPTIRSPHWLFLVCFSQHIFLCNRLEDNLLQFLRKPHLMSVCSPSPVSRQCPHLCISPSKAPVFILSCVGPSVSAFPHEQGLRHLLAGPFILRVAAITEEKDGECGLWWLKMLYESPEASERILVIHFSFSFHYFSSIYSSVFTSFVYKNNVLKKYFFSVGS